MSQKTLAKRTKAVGDPEPEVQADAQTDAAPPVEEPIEDVAVSEADNEMAEAEEPLGAQQLRRMVSHLAVLKDTFATLMTEYDEVLNVLEHEQVRGHVEKVLADLEAKMTGIEEDAEELAELFNEHYPELEPLDTTGAGTEPEIEEEIPEPDMAVEPEAEETVETTSGDETPDPTPEEVVEGMEAKGTEDEEDDKEEETKALPKMTRDDALLFATDEANARQKVKTTETKAKETGAKSTINTKAAKGIKKKDVCPGCDDPNCECQNKASPGTEEWQQEEMAEPEHQEPQIETKGGACECRDPGCPVCHGRCSQPSSETLYRSDMEDATGTPMCDGCADDAMQSGVFHTKDGDMVESEQEQEPSDSYAVMGEKGLKVGEVEARDELRAKEKAIRAFGPLVTLRKIGKSMTLRLKRLEDEDEKAVEFAGYLLKEFAFTPNLTDEQRTKAAHWHKQVDDMVDEKKKKKMKGRKIAPLVVATLPAVMGMVGGGAMDADKEGWTDEDLDKVGGAAKFLAELGEAKNLSEGQREKASQYAKQLSPLGQVKSWHAIFTDGTDHDTNVDDRSDEGVHDAVEDADSWARDAGLPLRYELVWKKSFPAYGEKQFRMVIEYLDADGNRKQSNEFTSQSEQMEFERTIEAAGGRVVGRITKSLESHKSIDLKSLQSTFERQGSEMEKLGKQLELLGSRI